MNFFQIEGQEAVIEKALDLFDEEPSHAESEQIDKQLRRHVKKVIEALLFTSAEPLTLVKIREITETIIPLRPRQLRSILEELKQEYLAHQRAFRLEEIAEGYVFRTHEEYSSYLDLLHRQKRGEKLSPASTEVLAIIAYRQPITRPQIDAIRGVDSSGISCSIIRTRLDRAGWKTGGSWTPHSLWNDARIFKALRA